MISCLALSQTTKYGFTITTVKRRESVEWHDQTSPRKRSSNDSLLWVTSWHSCFGIKRKSCLWTSWRRVQLSTQSGTRNFTQTATTHPKARPNRNMKDVLLLHDNAWPHTILRTREAIARMWTVFPHPAHSPNLAQSDSHLFGAVKDVQRGHHFADDNELKQSFRDVLRSRGRELYNNGIRRLTERWQQCVENNGDFVEKQPHN
jgi:hypothetical protein